MYIITSGIDEVNVFYETQWGDIRTRTDTRIGHKYVFANTNIEGVGAEALSFQAFVFFSFFRLLTPDWLSISFLNLIKSFSFASHRVKHVKSHFWA